MNRSVLTITNFQQNYLFFNVFSTSSDFDFFKKSVGSSSRNCFQSLVIHFFSVFPCVPLISVSLCSFFALLACGCMFVCCLIFGEYCAVLSRREYVVHLTLRKENQKIVRWQAETLCSNQRSIQSCISCCVCITDDGHFVLKKLFSVNILNWLKWKWTWTKTASVTVLCHHFYCLSGYLLYMGKSWIHVPGKVISGWQCLSFCLIGVRSIDSCLRCLSVEIGLLCYLGWLCILSVLNGTKGQ